jgi:hypothetical protein
MPGENCLTEYRNRDTFLLRFKTKRNFIVFRLSRIVLKGMNCPRKDRSPDRRKALQFDRPMTSAYRRRLFPFEIHAVVSHNKTDMVSAGFGPRGTD